MRTGFLCRPDLREPRVATWSLGILACNEVIGVEDFPKAAELDPASDESRKAMERLAASSASGAASDQAAEPSAATD